ncbi:MAG: T9SS type A sorting domain-containing protein [Candidatus Hydrothermia bacterium]
MLIKILLIFLTAGTAKIAFLHHGNQHFSDNGNYALRPGDYGYNGNSFHRTLDTHEYYDCPLDIHISGTLLQSYTWMQNDRGLINRLCGDVVNIVGGTYAEHIIPYVERPINKFSLWYAKSLYDSILRGVSWPDFPNVIWIPERVFKSELLMPYSLIKVLNEEYGKYYSQGRYLAPCIVLDDNVHDWYEHYFPSGTRCTNSRKVHRMFDNEGNYVFVVFIQRVARDQMVWNDVSQPSNHLHQLLVSLANDPDQEQIVIYGDDWEKAAGVAGWDFGQPGVPAWSYDHNISFIKSQSWIQPVHIAEAVKWWGVEKIYDSDPYNDPPTITIHYSAYQELHDWTGGNYDNWYYDFINTQAWGCTNGPDLNGNEIHGDYEDLWIFGYNELVNSPDNELSKLGWITLSSMLYETAWHTGPGGELVFWGKNLWNHTRYAGIFSFGARWLDSLRLPGIARLDSLDMDADGEKEYALYNDKICLIFDKRGGRALALFTSEGKCIAGNLISNWNGEGDYNDGGHPGIFHDSQGENSYFSVQTAIQSDTAVITFQEQYNWQGQPETDLRKTFCLTPGKNFVKAVYSSSYTNWTKAGVTPSLYLQILKGYNLQPIMGISPNGWTYAGYMSLYDSIKVAFLYPSGQGFYFNFLGKMSSGAELIELGGKSGTHTFYLYAGTNIPDVDLVGPGDLEGPWIRNTRFTPDFNILPSDSVLITAYITDPSEISAAWIRYTSNNWQSYQDLQLHSDDGMSRDFNGNGQPDPDLYGAFITPHPNGTQIIFAIGARDNSPRRNEAWDNNYGQNYSYRVGFQDFVMDGQLDRVATLVSFNGGMHLYLYYDTNSKRLYVATESAGNSSAGASGSFYNDHFIFISFNPNILVNAPWGKTGQVGKFHLFLADEDDNNFAGWFDSTGTLISDTINFKCASYFDDTGYLEGFVNLQLFQNSYSLDTIYIAVGSYATQNGGSLQWQVPPPVNPNGNIEYEEFYKLVLDTLPIHDSTTGLLFYVPTIVKSFNVPLKVVSPSSLKVAIKIFDIKGSLVDEIALNFEKGKNLLSVPTKIKTCGVYFIKIKTSNTTLTRSFIVVK